LSSFSGVLAEIELSGYDPLTPVYFVFLKAPTDVFFPPVLAPPFVLGARRFFVAPFHENCCWVGRTSSHPLASWPFFFCRLLSPLFLPLRL